MKTNLFGRHIDPACQYCEFGRLTSDGQVVLCTKKGSKQPFESCRLFDYAPLKRMLKTSAALPTYDKKDFEL